MEQRTEKTFLTITRTARVTGLSTYQLRKWQRQGSLPCIMCGNRAMVDVEELVRQIRSGELGGEAVRHFAP